MDFLKPEMLATIGGASLAVTIVTAVAKAVFCVSGRATQFTALGCSLVIAVVIGNWSSGAAALVSFLNGLIIYMVAVGLDQTANLSRRQP